MGHVIVLNQVMPWPLLVLANRLGNPERDAAPRVARSFAHHQLIGHCIRVVAEGNQPDLWFAEISGGDLSVVACLNGD